MSVLDSFMPMGFMLGLPLGTFLKQQYGSTVLYLTGVLTVSLAMVYVALVVKDSRKTGVRKDSKTPQGPVMDKIQAINKFPGFNKGETFSLLIEEPSFLEEEHSVTDLMWSLDADWIQGYTSIALVAKVFMFPTSFSPLIMEQILWNGQLHRCPDCVSLSHLTLTVYNTKSGEMP